MPEKVLFINPTGDLYGVASVFLQMIKFLPRDEFEPVVILPNPGPMEAVLAGLGIECIVLPLAVVRKKEIKGWGFLKFLGSILPSAIRLARIIRQRNIRIVHTNATVILSGAIAAWMARTPHVWHIHEITAEEFPRLWRFFGPVILYLSDQVICNSKRTKAQFHESRKVRLIYNGLDWAEFEKKVGASKESNPIRRLAPEGVTIGLIGRVSPRKGHDVLLEAFAQLQQRSPVPPAHLFIIGDTYTGYEPYHDSLVKKTQLLGLVDKVHFPGFFDDIASIYAGLDIVVLPSVLPEGFGMVILEAMAAHCPVIASADGGPLEIIEDGCSGLLVEPGNVTALSSALEILVQSRAERQRFAEAGYRRVQLVFDARDSAEQLWALYRQILK